MIKIRNWKAGKSYSQAWIFGILYKIVANFSLFGN